MLCAVPPKLVFERKRVISVALSKVRGSCPEGGGGGGGGVGTTIGGVDPVDVGALSPPPPQAASTTIATEAVVRRKKFSLDLGDLNWLNIDETPRFG